MRNQEIKKTGDNISLKKYDNEPEKDILTRVRAKAAADTQKGRKKQQEHRISGQPGHLLRLFVVLRKAFTKIENIEISKKSYI